MVQQPLEPYFIALKFKRKTGSFMFFRVQTRVPQKHLEQPLKLLALLPLDTFAAKLEMKTIPYPTPPPPSTPPSEDSFSIPTLGSAALSPWLPGCPAWRRRSRRCSRPMPSGLARWGRDGGMTWKQVFGGGGMGRKPRIG